MLKILKYLKNSKLAVLFIVILLIISASCELALPQYTSNIVDIGIQQSGIENAAPKEIRQETLENLMFFMTKDEVDKVKSFYTLNDNGNYELNTKNKEKINELSNIFGIPILMLSNLKESSDYDINTFKEMKNSGLISNEQILEIRDKMTENFSDLNELLISQKSVLFIKDEYKSIGIDLSKLQTDYLLKTGSIMLGLTIILVICIIIVSLIASQTAAKIGMNLREQVFSKVISFSNTEVNKFSTASLITRSTNDIQQVQMVCVLLLRMVIYAPILGIGGVIKVASTKTGMGWIIGVAVGVIILLVGILMYITMPKFKKMQTLVDKVNLISREILTGVSVIRAFSREKHEEARFEVANKNLMKTQLFTNRIMSFMMPAMMLIMNIITLVIVWFGAKGVDLGNLQVGDMMAFITYTMQIVMSFLMLTMISVMLPRASVAAGRIDEVIDTELSINDTENAKDNELKNCKGIVKFDSVSFAYPDAEKNTVENISFTAKPGETTAIIGSTGSGKSTVLNLIPRFFDVISGKITIDGVDIRDISQYKLRSLIGYVPQKGILFSGDIESNLKFGGSCITDETMKEAAAIAQAKVFIEDKPDKYKSSIAQGGTNVSGGQKQRLSIARAIAKKPKIFLFDDSFSALDYKTDAVLRKTLNEKITDATIIIVAQRVSTILHANQIIVLDDGEVVGIGTHRELLKNCKTYLEIAKSQLSEKELKGEC